MTVGLVIAVAAVVLAVGVGAWRARPARFRARPSRPASSSVLGGTPLAGELGSRATLLQFSSVACAPCRATSRVLDEVAASVAGVGHVELDVVEHLDLVRRLDIRRTPTTVVIDGEGREVSRATGVPTRDDVLRSVADLSQAG